VIHARRCEVVHACQRCVWRACHAGIRAGPSYTQAGIAHVHHVSGAEVTRRLQHAAASAMAVCAARRTACTLLTSSVSFKRGLVAGLFASPACVCSRAAARPGREHLSPGLAAPGRRALRRLSPSVVAVVFAWRALMKGPQSSHKSSSRARAAPPLDASVRHHSRHLPPGVVALARGSRRPACISGCETGQSLHHSKLTEGSSSVRGGLAHVAMARDVDGKVHAGEAGVVRVVRLKSWLLSGPKLALQSA
jgi:hypothetical protein